jgi:CheY-like chemotaxis protein
MVKLKILVVDDLFANQFLMKEIIKTIGHIYIEAKNGKEAVEYLEKETPDIIFMDIEMPVMNGLETVTHIRKKMPHPTCNLPVVALTAHNPEIFFDDYKDVKFDQIMTKPYTMQRVEAMLLDFFPDMNNEK